MSLFKSKIKRTALDLPAKLNYSKLVRDFALDFFLLNEIPEHESRKLILVLDEIFMNAVRYGSDENSFVRIWFENTPEGVNIGVEDEGVGIKKIKVKDLETLVENNLKAMTTNQTCGRGIALIANKLTDKLEFSASDLGGICVTFTRLKAHYQTKSRRRIPFIENQSSAKKETSLDYAKLSPRQVMLKGAITHENIEMYVREVGNLIEANNELLLILNFSELRYINSAFIGVLNEWHKALHNRGGELVVFGATGEVYDTINICGIWKFIMFYDTIEHIIGDLKITIK